LIGDSPTEINPQTTPQFTSPSSADPVDGTRNDPEVILKSATLACAGIDLPESPRVQSQTLLFLIKLSN
jgi:hypothetical protein